MNHSELQKLGQQYFQLLEELNFEKKELDYSVMNNHEPFLDRLSEVNNSAVTVFDLAKKQHIYASYNFSELFGYDMGEIEKQGNEYFDSRVHPDDLVMLMKNGIEILELYAQLPVKEKTNYKFVTEYRVLGKEDTYIRVIEQHQSLELDKKGNIWLTLGVIDISPDQGEFDSVKYQMYNYKTGEVFKKTLKEEEEKPKLSKRETQVLQLVKDGFLSKEISSKLSISVHTVNTHRQRILQRLGANNSLEAIAYASRFSLVK
jgi:DNA-binding CsgD family transcriptional regulator/PAS domain-containing protein